MNDGNNRVLVLADDFTGANDAGVSLAEAGMSVEVAFTAGQPINRPGINSQQRQPGDDRRRGGGQGRRSAARRGDIRPALAGKEDRLHAAR